MKTIQGIKARLSLTTRASQDQALDRSVVRRDSKQVGDASQQDEKVDGKTAVHLLHALAHEDAADERGHQQRKGAEVDRPQGADEKDEH